MGNNYTYAQLYKISYIEKKNNCAQFQDGAFGLAVCVGVQHTDPRASYQCGH